MTGVHDRGIAAGREKASANLIITVDLARDRNTGLELQFCFHVDDDISPERRACGRDAATSQPAEDLAGQRGDDSTQLLHAH
jgi:hypothetical protein